METVFQLTRKNSGYVSMGYVKEVFVVATAIILKIDILITRSCSSKNVKDVLSLVSQEALQVDFA